MNILALISFIFLLESLTYEILYGKTWRFVSYSIFLLVSAIPVSYSIYEFFTSPRSKLKRLIYSFYSLVYTDQVEAYLSKKSLFKGFIYCNEFLNCSANCFHGRCFGLCEADDESDPINFDYITGITALDLALVFDFKLESEEVDYLKGKGLSERMYSIKEKGRSFGGEMNTVDTLDIINLFKNRSGFSVRYNIKIEKLSLTLDYFPPENKVNYMKHSSLHDKVFQCFLECETPERFMYTAKFYSSIKSLNRQCCFVLSLDYKQLRGGDRGHFLPINFVTQKLLSGVKIKYLEYRDTFKCIESIEFDSMWVKFGERAEILFKLIENRFGNSEVFNGVVSYLVKCESCLKPKTLKVSNWQWKRFARDYSFLRELVGFGNPLHVDKKVRVSKKLHSFLEKNEELLIKAKESEEPSIVRCFKYNQERDLKRYDESELSEIKRGQISISQKNSINNVLILRKVVKRMKEPEQKFNYKNDESIEWIKKRMEKSRTNEPVLYSDALKSGLFGVKVSEVDLPLLKEESNKYTKCVLNRVKSLNASESLLAGEGATKNINEWFSSKAKKGSLNKKSRDGVNLIKGYSSTLISTVKIIYGRINDNEHYSMTQSKITLPEKKVKKSVKDFEVHKLVMREMSRSTKIGGLKKSKYKKRKEKIKSLTSIVKNEEAVNLEAEVCNEEVKDNNKEVKTDCKVEVKSIKGKEKMEREEPNVIDEKPEVHDPQDGVDSDISFCGFKRNNLSPEGELEVKRLEKEIVENLKKSSSLLNEMNKIKSGISKLDREMRVASGRKMREISNSISALKNINKAKRVEINLIKNPVYPCFDYEYDLEDF